MIARDEQSGLRQHIDVQPSDLLSQLSGKRKWCFDTEKQFILCEPLKWAALVWLDESKKGHL